MGELAQLTGQITLDVIKIYEDNAAIISALRGRPNLDIEPVSGDVTEAEIRAVEKKIQAKMLANAYGWLTGFYRAAECFGNQAVGMFIDGILESISELAKDEEFDLQELRHLRTQVISVPLPMVAQNLSIVFDLLLAGIDIQMIIGLENESAEQERIDAATTLAYHYGFHYGGIYCLDFVGAGRPEYETLVQNLAMFLPPPTAST